MAGVNEVAVQCDHHKKSPNKLYELCLTNLVNYLQKAKCDRQVLRTLPDNVLMDVYIKMLHEKKHCILGHELSQLHIFERLLRFSGNHLDLLQCFQVVIEHGDKLSVDLATAYVARCDEGSSPKDALIQLGLRLGSFLNEAGWYADAERVLIQCRDLCQAQPQTTYYKRLTLECCHRLLNTQSAYCCFPAAAETYSLALQLMGISEEEAKSGRVELPTALGRADSCAAAVQTEPEDELVSRLSALERDEASEGGGGCVGRAAWGGSALGARLCKELSALFFVRCDYSLAHAWAARALRMLQPHHPPALVVDVLRVCAKASVVKRRFVAAGYAARAAVAAARQAFGEDHPRFAAALLDLGFYLLNIDSIVHSVAVYEEALAILRAVFGRSSLHVATAQEDLAYALYVLEYSSGRFYKAREHAERAIRIIQDLVPPEHLLLASAKRVKALILEEIALDTPAGQDPTISQPTLLEESEALHRAALALSMMAFGEKNVQTAKHYGNLGRLYQSMHKFHDAETMHLKAIAIKEELLGPEDYEVGLSIGHLASLYNYHMNMHQEAEQLYLRSIAISLKLFGERYSGLEYDYRGLVHVFSNLKQHDQADYYTRLLHQWSELRGQYRAEPHPVLQEEVISLEELQAKFFGND